MSARVFGGVGRSSESWTDDLNFEACDAAIDSRITSSGGASRSRINAAGARVAAAGSARVSFNPVTLAAQGLLNEPGRVQLMTAPNDISNAAWSKAAVTPSGVDTLRETAANGFHYIVQGSSITVGDTLVMYCEVKADGRAVVIVQIAVGGDALQAGFDLNNLATGGYAVPFGTASSIQRASVALEDGWAGLQVSGICSATSNYAGAHVFLTDGAGNSSYTGDITKGVKVRNLNFGPGRFATSPILSAATATPATHFISGAAFAQYFANQGTYLIEFTPYALTNNEVYWGIGQAGVFNNSMYLVNAAGSLGLYVISGGVAQATLDLGTLVAGTRHKVAISYKSGEIAARCNGGTERVSSGAMPAVIDTEGLLTTPWNGGSGYPAAYMHRRRFRPYPGRGQLYQLTA